MPVSYSPYKFLFVIKEFREILFKRWFDGKTITFLQSLDFITFFNALVTLIGDICQVMTKITDMTRLKTIACFLLVAKYFSTKAEFISGNTDTFLDNKPFISWARDHTFPLQHLDNAIDNIDLQSLKKMIGNARVVA